MKLEQRYNQALAVTNKWFSQPRGQNGVGAEKDAALRMVIFSATLAIRVYMLNYVQQHEIGPILDECLELAVMFLGELRIISHTLRFIQDALSVRLAVFGSSMQSVSGQDAPNLTAPAVLAVLQSSAPAGNLPPLRGLRYLPYSQ